MTKCKAINLPGNATLLVERDDIEWLFDTHIGESTEQFTFFSTGSAAIIGNEDSPDEIWLCYSEEPEITDLFYKVELSNG